MTSCLQRGIIVVNRVNYNSDHKVVIINLSTINLPGKNSLINLNINITAEILEKMTLFMKMFQQGDKQYRKEFLRVSFDLEKLFRGGVDSFIGRTFLRGMAEAADFPLKLPLTKVTLHLIWLYPFQLIFS